MHRCFASRFPFRRAALALATLFAFPGIALAQDATPPAAPPPDPNPPADTAAPPADKAPTAQPPPARDPLREEVTALRDELQALRAQVESSRPAPGPIPPPVAPPPAAPPARPLGYEAFWPWVLPPDGLTPGGYVQAQYESHQDSQDQLAQGGAPLNQDRFLVRRARANFTGDWEYAVVAVELDANTTSGPQVDLRKAEASLQYRPDRSSPPMAMATLGQFDTPFGYELVESPRTRWFTERSTLSRAFWPGEPDLGVRFAGALGFFRWTIAPINGEPLGEKSSFALQDPNSAKDVVFRFGVDVRPRDDLHVAGGVSATRGRGFHAGTDATKATIRWVDLNEDGVVQPYELQAVPAQAATPSQNFDRWAAGLDVRVSCRTPLGVTKVYGEFVLGANMDRGTFVADPILNSNRDQRELGYYVGIVQELGRHAVIGFRYDVYDPNLDASDRRSGSLIPFSQAITTYSPLAGLSLPGRARLVFQYDVVQDALARSVTGVPTDLKNNAWTLRLQVEP